MGVVIFWICGNSDPAITDKSLWIGRLSVVSGLALRSRRAARSSPARKTRPAALRERAAQAARDRAARRAVAPAPAVDPRPAGRPARAARSGPAARPARAARPGPAARRARAARSGPAARQARAARLARAARRRRARTPGRTSPSAAAASCRGSSSARRRMASSTRAQTWAGSTARPNGGAHWVPLTDGYPASLGNYLGGESIAPDPSNANIVYAAAGMYESSGNGRHPQLLQPGGELDGQHAGRADGRQRHGARDGERLAVDPNNGAILYFGSRGSGLYKSVNSGGSWTKVTAFPTTGDVATGDQLGPAGRRLRPARGQRFRIDHHLRRRRDGPARGATSTTRPTAAPPGRRSPAGRPVSWSITRRSAATGPCGSPTATTTAPSTRPAT